MPASAPSPARTLWNETTFRESTLHGRHECGIGGNDTNAGLTSSSLPCTMVTTQASRHIRLCNLDCLHLG